MVEIFKETPSQLHSSQIADDLSSFDFSAQWRGVQSLLGSKNYDEKFIPYLISLLNFDENQKDTLFIQTGIIVNAALALAKIGDAGLTAILKELRHNDLRRVGNALAAFDTIASEDLQLSDCIKNEVSARAKNLLNNQDQYIKYLASELLATLAASKSMQKK